MDSSRGETTEKGKDQMRSSHCCKGILKERHHDMPHNNNCSGSHVPSTVSIMEMARADLLQYTSSNKQDACSIASSSVDAPCGLSAEASDDLELAFLLQASAEMFSNQQFKHARKYLSLCNLPAAATDSPVRRVVHCYAEALQQRIDKETPSITRLPQDRRGSFEVEPIDPEAFF